MADALNPITSGASQVSSPANFDVSSNPEIYNQILQHYRTDVQMPSGWGPSSTDISNYTGKINSDTQQFASQFENMVGRAPTQDEVNKFYTNFVIPHTNDIGYGVNTAFNQQSDSNINQFVSQNFNKAAQDYATQQLQGQQTQANSLADLFRTQGNQAISDTENSLLDYQSKLFDRLRPNLITSLKAQGLLDTGGMNEALAGQQGDMANSAANYVAQLKLQNDQAANQIAFSGASAPYQYQQSNIMNQPGYMQTQGQNAMQQNYGTFMNQLNYQNQLGLIQAQTKAQSSLQPSFLRTMGQGFAGGLGQSMGSGLGQWFSPGAFSSSAGGASGASGLGSMLPGAAAASARGFKKDISKLTEAEEEAIYEQMASLPLNRWRYKTESPDVPRHIGTMTDEALPVMVTEDGNHLSVVDYLGCLTVAFKVLNRKTAGNK